VQSLVPPILLRLAGRAALGADAQLDPPNCQPREPAGSRRGNGQPVIRTDRLRQPVLAERRLKDRPLMGLVWSRRRLAAQQVAAMGIAQGQPIAPPPVADAKPLP